MLYPHQEDFVLISCFELGIKLECKQKKLCKHRPNVWKSCFPCLRMFILLRRYISKCLSLNCNQVLCQGKMTVAEVHFIVPNIIISWTPHLSFCVSVKFCAFQACPLLYVYSFIIKQGLCVFCVRILLDIFNPTTGNHLPKNIKQSWIKCWSLFSYFYMYFKLLMIFF